MARRKPKSIVPVREPNGRFLRSVEAIIDASPPNEARRLRDAACAGMAAPEWGTELGRLFLAGKIGPRLFETGKRWAGLVAAYHHATGAPPEAPNASVFAQSGKRRDADPDSEAGLRQVTRERQIIAATEEALAILSACGRGRERAVRAVCEHNIAPVGERGMTNLLIGLGFLAQHWGIIDFRKAS